MIFRIYIEQNIILQSIKGVFPFCSKAKFTSEFFSKSILIISLNPSLEAKKEAVIIQTKLNFEFTVQIIYVKFLQKINPYIIQTSVGYRQSYGIRIFENTIIEYSTNMFRIIQAVEYFQNYSPNILRIFEYIRRIIAEYSANNHE